MANNNKVTQSFKDIAQAIRNKTGDEGKMTAADMPEKINEIPVGIEPEGQREIRANGEYNIREYETVNVNVPGATTKEQFTVTANGIYDIAEYANVNVNVPNPSDGVLNIVANGEYNVTDKAGVNVNVPVPDGYVLPEGELEITENNYYDVGEYKSVYVDVEPNPDDLFDNHVEDSLDTSYWYRWSSSERYTDKGYVSGYFYSSTPSISGTMYYEEGWGRLPSSSGSYGSKDSVDVKFAEKISGSPKNGSLAYFRGSDYYWEDDIQGAVIEKDKNYSDMPNIFAIGMDESVFFKVTDDDGVNYKFELKRVDWED